MRTVCVEAEQKNAEQENRLWLEGLLTVREYKNFLEGQLAISVASVACVVSRRCPIFGILQEYCRSCWFFQILSCIHAFGESNLHLLRTCELHPLLGKKWFEQWRIVATLSLWK